METKTYGWSPTFDLACQTAEAAARRMLVEHSGDAEMTNDLDYIADYLSVGDIEAALWIIREMRPEIESAADGRMLDEVENPALYAFHLYYGPDAEIN